MTADQARDTYIRALARRGVTGDAATPIVAAFAADAYFVDGTVDAVAIARLAGLVAGPGRARSFGAGGDTRRRGSVHDGQAEAEKRFGAGDAEAAPRGLRPRPAQAAQADPGAGQHAAQAGGPGAAGKAEAAKRFGTNTTDSGGRAGNEASAAAPGPRQAQRGAR